MKKNQMQTKSQELILSTYEYTTMQLEEQSNNFQLRNVLDIFKDFNVDIFRNLIDITDLCIRYNINPVQKEQQPDPNQEEELKSDFEPKNFYERLEDSIKNVLFESSYLNEKILGRNQKIKSILYPTLKKKQILEEVLVNLWTSSIKVQKADLDLQREHLKQNNEKLKKQQEGISSEHIEFEKKLKGLKLELMQQKAHKYKIAEIAEKV